MALSTTTAKMSRYTVMMYQSATVLYGKRGSFSDTLNLTAMTQKYVPSKISKRSPVREAGIVTQTMEVNINEHITRKTLTRYQWLWRRIITTTLNSL
mmetsp:Transcript_10867/g.31860  ORF Transcript_10867/g.31860 Transcript_10867/m.31860 type:complete len:97 (+) Transcript_10867:356-646(+)|eukprot:CAMPEP_0168472082 /NCGR_PEP_ID=MMETSP0228-20121227/59618_1 /TAXON_ID=133427 /ORGANISM="Protoceratium reticulatum, Strain CCCM 535 (=CCMP 1889)" /LENGTH=96 /DNA_ID=CAMNT_0008488019 /DNA_START=347 /DNA_END=637 /DNA_ORIENTATION=-